METLTFRRPRIIALILFVAVSLGLSAALTIPRQEDPTITNIFARVTTPFPGADPARVETLVTAKIEEHLRRVPEVDNINSTSATGISVIVLELVETLPDDRIEQAWSEIRNVLDDAKRDLPAGAGTPEFDNDIAGAYSAIVSLTAEHGAASLIVTSRYADELADILRNLDGTKRVDVFGKPDEEVLVTVDPSAAAALGLTADGISRAITAADSKVEAGRLRAAGSDLVVNVSGEITALDRLRRIVLRHGPNGQVTLLGDIATVTRGPRSPATEAVIHDGKPAILVAARLKDGVQVDVWTHDARRALDRFEANLPAALDAELVFDQSVYTANRLIEVAINMAIGIALVIAVLFLTLGARAAFVVALILPLVAFLTVATMKLIGLAMHQMSVTGMIVALGMLVDAAIVMTDEIAKRLSAGQTRLAAVAQSVRRLAAPLFASTATTALSFTPMILLPGPVGDFIGSVAIAVVIMVVWSFVVALSVTPAIGGWMLKAERTDLFLSKGLEGGRFARAFHWSLRVSFANPLKSVTFALALPVLGFLSYPALHAQFFPGADRNQFHIEIELQPGAPLQKTSDVVGDIDEHLRDQPGIVQITWVIGRSAPAFYYNMRSDREFAPEFAQALVRTTSPATTERLLHALQYRLNEHHPEARILVRGLVQGPPVNAPVELRIIGPDIETLRRLGDAARRVAARQQMVTVARTTVNGGAPKISIEVDEARARLLGLDLTGIARQLAANLEGETGGSLVEGTEELPVRVRMGDGLREALDAVTDMTLVPPNAASRASAGHVPGIPLSALSRTVVKPAESAITRRNAERVNTLQVFLVHGVLPEEALKATLAALKAEGFDLPRGYRMEVGGDANARADALSHLVESFGVVAILSVATVFLALQSFTLTAVAFAVSALSVGLSLLSLAVFGYPFGINAVVGVIGSVGVSINAAIIILTGLREDVRAMRGDRDAMTEVVYASSRHIVSTTTTTFGGFLPLILGGGAFWPPFAMAIAGGVLLSAIVSFYFTAQMFALVTHKRFDDETEAPVMDDDPQPVLRVAAE